MSYKTDLKLPDNVQIKDPTATLQAVLNIVRDATVIGKAGETNLASVKCNVEGLTLGHWYKLLEGLGEEVTQHLINTRLEEQT